MKSEWEKLTWSTHRMKVPGGWIVRECYYKANEVGPGVGASVSLIFIEDCWHGWQLDNKKEN